MFSRKLIFGRDIMMSVIFYRLCEHFALSSDTYDICVLLPPLHPLQIGL